MPKTPIRRFWQDECDVAFDDIVTHGGKGQLILPTGTGKTRIAINQMVKHVRLSQRHGFFGVVVPRLLLSTQWIQEMAELFLGKHNKDSNTVEGGSNVPVSFVVVSTGNVTKDILDPIRACLYGVIQGHTAEAVVVTTSPQEIRTQVAMRQRANQSTIVAISTYHSSERLADASKVLTTDELQEQETCNIGPLDICFYDECHYLVNGRLEEMSRFECALSINSRTSIFMTATPKLTGDDWEYGPGMEAKGMQNEERFGPVIYYKSPLEMIEAGAIVGPQAYLIGSDETDEEPRPGDKKDYLARITACHNALAHLRQSIKEESSAPEKIGAKLLVICDGQDCLEGVFQHPKFAEFKAANPGLKVYGLCSTFGCFIDGEHHANVTNSVKDKLLLALRSLESSDEAIIFHVDMISEGLDVRGINAILPFKNCGTIKFLQNLGRATRLHPEDAYRIFDEGSLKPSRTGKNYIKPCCNVYLPYLFEGRDDVAEECFDRIFDLMENYGFDPSELTELSFSYPAQKPDEFGTAVIRQIRDSKVAPEIKNMHIEKVDKEFGLKKYRWSRLFFKNLTPEQIQDLIDSTPPLIATPQINFN